MGTRVETLNSITEHLIDPTKPNILWLHGVAGAGKSTISTTIAQHFFNLHRRYAFLHFDRNDPLNGNPNSVIRTLARQLAGSHPAIDVAISEQLKNNIGIENTPLSAQFECLLREPLVKLTSLASDGPVIIILDALDECGDPASRKDLLKVLRQGLPRLPPVARLLESAFEVIMTR